MNQADFPFREVIVAEGDVHALREWLGSALGPLACVRDGSDSGLWQFTVKADPLVHVWLARRTALRFHYLVSVIYDPAQSADTRWQSSFSMAQEAAGCLGCDVITPVIDGDGSGLPSGNYVCLPNGDHAPIDLNNTEP